MRHHEKSTALPAHYYRDPAKIYEDNEAKTCKGCKHIDNVLGKQFCLKGKKMTRRCKLYPKEAE